MLRGGGVTLSSMAEPLDFTDALHCLYSDELRRFQSTTDINVVTVLY